MFTIIRTDNNNSDFQQFVSTLDKELALRDGDEHSFFAQFNKLDNIKNVIVYYQDNAPVGCGAFKAYDEKIAEIKRMFVLPEHRCKGVASQIILTLERWAAELGYTTCILETGIKQPEAIRLYSKNNYERIPNFGQYENVPDSVCMQKQL